MTSRHSWQQKIGWPFVVVFYKIKLPHALHREIVGRAFLLKALSFVLGLIGKESCASRFTVLLVHIDIVPSARILRQGCALTAES